MNTEKQYEEDISLLDDTTEENKLILYNDDHNTFDFVIESLIEVCGHSIEQAEQCTMLVHYKGKCAVKIGSRDKLTPMNKKLLSRGLTSEIE